jgi:hypothetical protein
MWDVDAPGTYRLSIQVTAEGLTATKENIAIVVSNDAPAPATTFTIYGESTINGVAGLSSTSSYSAVDNTGNDVTNNST